MGFSVRRASRSTRKKSCKRTSNLQADTIDFQKIPSGTTVTSEFQEAILNHFRDDAVGVLCCNDPTILLLVQNSWVDQFPRTDTV